ncbi:MAG: cation:proton antiporter [Candidatus Nanohaloarchaea archaeon]|nr:cation:proton antiporter [Candidatus Nanohaloarchaea archaeon]
MAAETTILFDVGMIIIAATILGVVAKMLRQPLIGAYILAGILIGPDVLGIVRNTEVIRMFAELGVAFLLFMVGLELDLSRLKEVRNVVLGAALTEVMFLFSIGFFIMYLLGFGGFPAIYVGLFIAFNSTAVLIKLLADRGDLDTLHGRIILGILLIQDIIVVLALSVLSTLNTPGLEIIASAIVQGAGLFALAVVLSKYVMPNFFALIDDSHEIVLLSSVAILFAFVGAAVETGFSAAVGGFLAGIALTAFPYNIEIAERARSMRDFFVTIFFVSLGMLVSLSHLSKLLVPFVVLLAAILLLKPFFVTLMVSLFGYGRRTSFYTGLNLSQVSEFSMVLALLGLQMGHIDTGIFSLVTALMVVSITITSYAVKYQINLYELFGEFVVTFRDSSYEESTSDLEDHVVVCGVHIKGRKILRFLEDHDESIVVIDHDPEIISWAQKEEDIDPVYGDIEDALTLERANVEQAKAVISTVPDAEDNRYLVNYLEKHNPDAVSIVSSDDMESALLLYEEGADYVLYPEMLAAKEASEMVEQLYEDGGPLEQAREEHIEELEREVEKEILARYEPQFIQQLRNRVQEVSRRGDDE